MARRIGVCSWSLRAGSPRELAAKVREAGLDAVQLALDPLRTGVWDERETAEVLADSGVTILSGMMATEGEDYSTLESIRLTGGVRADEYWETNLAGAHADAEIASRLGIDLVTFHAGFIPEDPSDRLYTVMVERLRRVIDAFAERGVRITFETGQERAETLLDVLGALQRPAAGVNFDPANMILYGMGDPVRSLELLAPRVAQIHIKDALPAESPGAWGTEVPAGTGAVVWDALFEVAGRLCPEVDLLIEREAGESRIADIASARAMISARLGK